MRIKEARSITRKFIREEIEYKPVLAGDWVFELDEWKLKVKLTSIINDVSIQFVPVGKYTTEYMFNPNFEIINNTLRGNYYLTSVGLIEESVFFEAEDIIELNKTKISEKDLEKGRGYTSNLGEHYIYLGKLDFTQVKHKNNGDKTHSLVKENILTDSFSYSLKNKNLVKTNSLKFVKEEPKSEEILYIYIELYYLNIHADYLKLNTTIDNIDFTGGNKNSIKGNLEFYMEESLEEMMEFIASEEKEMKLTLRVHKKESLLSKKSIKRMFGI